MMDKTYIQKIVVKPPLTLDELRMDVERGGRFVIFQYCISFLFGIPGKWDRREFIKAFAPVFKSDYNLRGIVVGHLICPQEGEQPHHVFGIDCVTAFENYPGLLKNALNRRFKKTAHFSFADLHAEDLVSVYLKLQGDILFYRPIDICNVNYS